jgi:Zn-dependent M32 family carboxypeptidase
VRVGLRTHGSVHTELLRGLCTESIGRQLSRSCVTRRASRAGSACLVVQEVRKPKALAKLEASLSSEGYHAWVKARDAADGAGDFSLFAPALRKLVQVRELPG